MKNPRSATRRTPSALAVAVAGCVTVAVTGCASTGAKVPADVFDSGETVAVRVALPAGTRIGLPETRFTSLSGNPPRYLVDGLWRVAMRQSVRFDVAAGVESCSSPTAVELHLDSDSLTFTTTLTRAGQAPIPLAAVAEVEGQPARPGPALDRLAVRTRRALGETIRVRPVACTGAYSATQPCVRFTEMGIERFVDGEFGVALKLLEQARSHDGGCPLTLLHLAVLTANLGGEANERRAFHIVREALAYKNRLTPSVEHRLARVMLLVNRDDDKLLELGQTFRRDRPFDPHGMYSEALAHNKSGRHREALPVLTTLARRWPRIAGVGYQLCYARLATGDAEGALAALDAARKGFLPNAIVRLEAMALYHAKRHEELRRYLRSVRRRSGVKNTPAEHEILRMQASHALLTGDNKAAIANLAESLAWVRQRRSQLSQYAVIVAEDGEVLSRLGGDAELTRAIAGFQELGQLPPAFANVMTYLGGLVAVQRGGKAVKALATLVKATDTVWHSQLTAAVHHRRGELSAETRALRRAVLSSAHPLLYATFARVLDAAGKHDESRKLSAFVRKTLLSFDQRWPREHPLMTPGRAMAFLAAR